MPQESGPAWYEHAGPLFKRGGREAPVSRAARVDPMLALRN